MPTGKHFEQQFKKPHCALSTGRHSRASPVQYSSSQHIQPALRSSSAHHIPPEADVWKEAPLLQNKYSANLQSPELNSIPECSIFMKNKSVLLLNYSQLHYFVGTENKSPNTRTRQSWTRKRNHYKKDSQKIINMQLLSSTHSRRVYIISYVIVLKQPDLRGKIQDVSVLSISKLT